MVAGDVWSFTAQTLDSRLLFVGHTHLPGIFLLGQSGTPHVVPPQDFELELTDLRDNLLQIAKGYVPNHDDRNVC